MALVYYMQCNLKKRARAREACGGFEKVLKKNTWVLVNAFFSMMMAADRENQPNLDLVCPCPAYQNEGP